MDEAFESLKFIDLTEEDLDSLTEIIPEKNVWRFDRTGIPHTEETKQLMRKPKSDAAKKRMSEGQKGKLGPNRGKKFTDEWKKNLSDSHLGKTPANKGKTGYFNHSDETKKKMSESRKGRIPWNKGKKLINRKIED